MRIPTELIELSKQIVNLSPWNIRAIILCGSYAKNDFSIIENEEGNEVLSDYDLEVLVKIYDPFLVKRINNVVSKFSMKTTAGVVPIFLLKTLKMVQTYEMKKNGIMIFGDTEILKKIPMENSSDIPKWEGIRYLLNANMELIESVRYKNLRGNMSKSQFKNIVYCCAKAYITCSKALLILCGEFRIKLSESYELFAKLFTKRFRRLYKQLPSLLEKVKFGVDFKLRPKLDHIRISPKIWFETRNHLMSTLEYCLSEYIQKPNESLFSLIEKLHVMSPKPLQNLAYIANFFFLKNRFPPLLTLVRIPILLAQLSGIYLGCSIDEKGNINENLLKKAMNDINKIYPLDVTLGRDKWDSIRTAILNIWKLAPDYILSV